MKNIHKKHRSFVFVRIMFILMLVVLFVSACGTNKDAGFAVNDGHETEESSEKNQGKDHICSKPLNLFPEDCNDVKIYDHSAIITKRLKIQGVQCDKISLKVSIPESITLLSDLPENVGGLDYIDVSFKINDDFTDGKIEFFAQSEYGICYTNLYLLHEGSYDYTSFLCMESFIPYSDRITQYFEDEWKKGESSYIVSEKKEDNDSQKGPAVYDVSGYIRWTDVNGGVHPARNIRVEVYKSSAGSTPSVTTTNSSGYYSVTWQSSILLENIYIRVLSYGYNISVKDQYSNIYYYQSGTYYNVSAGDSLNISYTGSNSNNLGKSLSVHQALELSNRYIYTLENSILPLIQVSYPNNLGTNYVSSSSGKEIRLLDLDAFDWDVIEHEFGHYVADYYGFISAYDGSHAPDSNLTEFYQNKSKGTGLAWNEGWATYFGINSQIQMGASSMNIPNVGDYVYTDLYSGLASYSIETITEAYRKGDANETTVAGILFDLTDGVNSADHDNVSCGNSLIWNLVKNSGASTLSDFISTLYGSSSITMKTKLDLGSTLTYLNVAARLTSYPDDLSSNNPAFSWDAQGGSTYNQCVNNSFRLVFYDADANLITGTNYTTNNYIALGSSQWNSIKSHSPFVYCCVETKQTNSPQTGPYYSECYLLNAPILNYYKITNASTGKCLNINGSNLTSLSNHTNVCLWMDSGSNEQKWYVSSIGNNVYIRSIIDLSYGLNAYRSGSPWNCDVLIVSGNETDAAVDFIATTGGYKIKLHNYNRYLSAGASSNGSNVYWAPESSSLYQVWTLTAL